MSKLIKKLQYIEKEKNPLKFKTSVLEIIQLYFDGIIENQFNSHSPEIWNEQSKILNSLFEATKITTYNYYENLKNLPYDKILNLILPYETTLLKYSSKKKSKNRHLTEKEHFINDFQKKLPKELKQKKIDLIIPISSGGFEPSALIAKHLNIEKILPVRYSPQAKKDKKVLTPNQMPSEYIQNNIYNKNILIIDDIAASGTTLAKTARWTEKQIPKQIDISIVLGGRKHLTYNGIHKQKNSNYLYYYKKFQKNNL